jgi:hypothetical protein
VSGGSVSGTVVVGAAVTGVALVGLGRAGVPGDVPLLSGISVNAPTAASGSQIMSPSTHGQRRLRRRGCGRAVGRIDGGATSVRAG